MKLYKISLHTQKKLCSLLYIFLRFPLCIYGVSMNYVGYMNNLINPENRDKPSNCVSHHDDVCFAEHDHEEENQE